MNKNKNLIQRNFKRDTRSVMVALDSISRHFSKAFRINIHKIGKADVNPIYGTDVDVPRTPFNLKG